MRCAAASSICSRPAWREPVRLDFFGDTLETIRSFDPETQRTTDQLRALDLVPVAEFQLTTRDDQALPPRLCRGFGAPTPDDLLYAAVSEGRRHPGMEHWLPLFHERLDTIFDYVPGSPVVLEPLDEDAARERLDQIKDYYDARVQALTSTAPAPPTGRCRPTGSISARPNGARASMRQRSRG